MSAWEVDERMENRERHEGRRRSGEGLGGEERDVTIDRHEERTITTPWGAPSDAYIVGHLGGREVAFLARHGRGHRISPSELKPTSPAVLRTTNM